MNVEKAFGLSAGYHYQPEEEQLKEPACTTMKETVEPALPGSAEQAAVYPALEKSVFAALETYSNVHRGSGHNSMVTTRLYEQARDVVLEYLELKKNRYRVIFCSPRRAEMLTVQLDPGDYHGVSSQEIGLPLGVRALAIKSGALSKIKQYQTGGGTARLVSADRVTWAKVPDRFEAGTPAIVNIIAFAVALRLIRKYGEYAFHDAMAEKSVTGEMLYHDQLSSYSGKQLLDELRSTLIGGNLHVPTLEGSRPFLNLDNGASTPTFSPIWDVVCRVWRQSLSGRQAIVEEARAVCSRFLGAPPDHYEVIFTSNTTESINLAAQCLGRASAKGGGSVVLNTYLEHTSNELPWRMTPGLSLIRLPVDDMGTIDLNLMETLLREYNLQGQHGKKRIGLVTVSGASNVLGVYNDIQEICRISHRYGARVLVDAAQLVAHRRVEMEKCGIDILAFSAHKVYAPFGCGVLVARKGLLEFIPEEREMIRLSGEENAGGIAALGKSLVLLQRIGMDLIQREEQVLTRRLLSGMSQIAGLKVYGVKDPESEGFTRKGGVVVFSLGDRMPNLVGKELTMTGGIGVRYGCHCAHLLIKRILNVSPALARFQHMILLLSHKINLPGLVRVSLGLENTESDVDRFLEVLKKIARSSKYGTGRQITAAQGEGLGLSKAHYQRQMDEWIRTATARVYH